MIGAFEERVSEIVLKQIKSAIVAIWSTGKRPDSKAIFNYITSKYASNTTESTITETTLIQQNVLINKPALKGDSYFVIENDNLNNDSLPDDENV